MQGKLLYTLPIRSSSLRLSIEYQLLGGLDITVLPRIDWRIVEYSYGGFSVPNSADYHPRTFTTGLVLRLPRVVPIP
jgi:hypothetical protein